jgi:hypothetical protein
MEAALKTRVARMSVVEEIIVEQTKIRWEESLECRREGGCLDQQRRTLATCAK